MSFATQLRRGLLATTFFAARFAWAGPETTVPGSNAYAFELEDFDGTMIAGKPETFRPRVRHTVYEPTTSYCNDPGEGEGGYGCGDPKPCSDWYTPTPQSHFSYAGVTVLEATCDANCEATISSAGITVTGKTANTTAHLHVHARSESGEYTEDYSIQLTSGELRLGRRGMTYQMPENAFVVGQTFEWCVLQPGSIVKTPAMATASGAVERTGKTTESGCDSFITKSVGTGQVVFTTSDGTKVTADVVTVAPTDVVALEYVQLPHLFETDSASSEEIIASATAVATLDADSSNTLCHDYAARFKTAEGRYGVLRGDATRTNASGGRTATIGTVTTSVAVHSGTCN